MNQCFMRHLNLSRKEVFKLFEKSLLQYTHCGTKRNLIKFKRHPSQHSLQNMEKNNKQKYITNYIKMK